MSCCCFLNCKSSRKNNPQKVTFHQIPVKEDVRRRWIEVVAAGRSDWHPSEHAIVCSLHFEDTDFKTGTKYRMLKPDAVPRTNSGDNPTAERSTQTYTPFGESTPELRRRLNHVRAKFTIARLELYRLKKKMNRRDKQRAAQTAEAKKTPGLGRDGGSASASSMPRPPLENVITGRLQEGAAAGSASAQFLLDQWKCYAAASNGKKASSFQFSDETLRHCVLLRAHSPNTYNYLRAMNVLALPTFRQLKSFVVRTPHLLDATGKEFVSKVQATGVQPKKPAKEVEKDV